MRLAVTGKNGQVTRALQALENPGLTIIPIGRPELELIDPDSVCSALVNSGAEAVISAAAYTAVDRAETETEMAFAVNRDGAAAVAHAASALDIPVLHLSTDYVFDGEKSAAYVETDPTGPATVYGRSKLDGELAVAVATPNHAIFRTAWVYSIYGNNFVKTMLRLGETRDTLNVVADQFGCPTSAHDIAAALVVAAEKLCQNNDPALRGLFHMAGGGEASWADFARFIFDARAEFGLGKVVVENISTEQYPTPAKRPANSRLDCKKLESVYGLCLPDWRPSTRWVVETLLRNSGGTE